ncbi:MAG TPA: ABC-2 family transporter protein [Anaerolineales bacterium]
MTREAQALTPGQGRLWRAARVYAAIVAMVPKTFLAYSTWFWMQFFVQILAMTIFVYFWRAVYSNTSTLGGLDLKQTLNYILLAQILLPVVNTRLILNFGFIVSQGMVAIELLRPVDFQGRYYVENLAGLALSLLLKLPLLLLAWLLFGLQLPANPLVWGAFLISLLLGHAVLFFFDWIFACLAFYSTETWGLNILREGVATFFSGALVPLTMMPGWLQAAAQAMPFSQALYVPVSILSGISPLSGVPRLWLVQLAWLAGLGLLSRLVFSLAVRKVTVQGG